MTALQDASPPPSSYPPPQGAPAAMPPPRQAAPAPRPGESIEVRPGDTLYSLSRHHNVSVAEMMEVNGLSNPSLQPGQRIYLPEGYRAQPRPEPRYEPRHEPSVATLAPEAPRSNPRPSFGRSSPPPAAPTSGFDGSYTVKDGDSVYAIAREHGTNVAELQQANGITDVRSIRPGTVLKVPGRASVADTSQPSPASDESSTVEPGTPPPQEEAPSTITVAPPDAPTGLGPTQPTVINRSEPQVAMRDDVPSGTIVPPAVTQPKRPTTGSDKLRWPVQGRILSAFGQRNDGTHNDGINLSVPLGTNVHAAEAGTVAYAGSELKGYGNLVLLRHDNGWVTAYAHNEEITVKRGDKVERGAVIARAGRSGSVDQPQVHFELRQGSKPVDPVPFLEQL
jgi:murein DD-endopeptidase MepM/ murein hydrolase activator NlpD